MAFEVVGSVRSYLAPGSCRINRNGSISLHVQDLTQLGIDDNVTLLVDRDTSRIAVRSPYEGDPTFRAKMANESTRSIRVVAATQALRALGLSNPSNPITLRVDVNVHAGMLFMTVDPSMFTQGDAKEEASTAHPTKAPSTPAESNPSNPPPADLNPPDAKARKRLPRGL